MNILILKITSLYALTMLIISLFFTFKPGRSKPKPDNPRPRLKIAMFTMVEDSLNIALLFSMSLLIVLDLINYIPFRLTFGLQIDEPLSYVGAFLLIIGSTIFTSAIIVLGKSLTSPYNPLKPDHELVIKGPYKITRHPVYFGYMLNAFGGILFFKSLLYIFSIIFLFVYILQAREEEYVLVNYFGDAYQEYQKKVGFIIPGIGKKK